MNNLKIGMVIADDMEFAPLLECGGEPFGYYGRAGRKFTFRSGERTVELLAVCCGVGKVNAAGAAMFLVSLGCEIILNAGLSGGVSNISRGELMLCTEYIEHDFDLTPLGYAPAVKPSQEYIYKSDRRLFDYFKKRLNITRAGVAVSGDCFVSDGKLRARLARDFSAMSCDMESAAVASVCHLTGKRFLSLRRISDDAGSTADSAYREMNENERFELAVLLLDGVRAMADEESFFNEGA